MKHTCWLFILHIIVLRGEKIISFFKKKNLFSQQTLRNLIPVKLNHLDYTIFNIRFPIKTTLSTVKTKNNMEKRATHFFSHLASFASCCFVLIWTGLDQKTQAFPYGNHRPLSEVGQAKRFWWSRAKIWSSVSPKLSRHYFSRILPITDVNSALIYFPRLLSHQTDDSIVYVIASKKLLRKVISYGNLIISFALAKYS